MAAGLPSRSHYDVIVVGARCAGAATAMLLARHGARVLVIDRGRYGSDTLSTLALMRAGVYQLHRWGVLPAVEAAGTPPVRQATFHYGDETVVVPIKPRDGVAALYAPRRSLLDRLLVDAAVAAGAEVRYGLRLAALQQQDGGHVQGVVVEDLDGNPQRVRADLVIGADGLRSTVARLAGAETYRKGRHATGAVYGFWRGLDVEGYHWHYNPGVGVGAIPTNDGETCVFAATSARRFREEVSRDVPAQYLRVLSECAPDLASRVARAERSGSLHGFPGQAGFMRRSWGPGWALVGDAGYFKDPLTAHGITDALRDAELLSRAVARGTGRALADYEAERDELSTGLFDVTDKIASFEWDLHTVRAMHKALSDEMSREVAAIARFADTSAQPITTATMEWPVRQIV